MGAIDWVETPLVDDGDTLATPGTTRDIINSLNASVYENVWLTADTTGGTAPSLTVTVWLWNETRYVKTGDVLYLRPGARNLSRHNGGGYIAYEISVAGSPTAWALNVGGQR